MLNTTDPYLSRSDNVPRLLDRLDPVVYGKYRGNESDPLTCEQTDFYERNGYLHLEELFSKNPEGYVKGRLQSDWFEIHFLKIRLLYGHGYKPRLGKHF